MFPSSSTFLTFTEPKTPLAIPEPRVILTTISLDIVLCSSATPSPLKVALFVNVLFPFKEVTFVEYFTKYVLLIESLNLILKLSAPVSVS